MEDHWGRKKPLDFDLAMVLEVDRAKLEAEMRSEVGDTYDLLPESAREAMINLALGYYIHAYCDARLLAEMFSSREGSREMIHQIDYRLDHLTDQLTAQEQQP